MIFFLLLQGGLARQELFYLLKDEKDVHFQFGSVKNDGIHKASIGMLQRAFKIGFNRAARIMDQLCEAGIVGGEEGTKPRKILMTPEEFEQYIQNINTTE